MLGRRWWLWLALLTLLIFVALQFQWGLGATPRVPKSEPDAEGTIVDPVLYGLTDNREVVFFLAVDADSGDGADPDADQPPEQKRLPDFAVTVTSATRIYVKAGNGSYDRVDADALQVGKRVQVWFSGPPRESHPAQATASDVVIVGGVTALGSI